MPAFFGSTTRVTHPTTGDEEEVLGFWLRHTVGRPRDVVSIGKVLASILAPRNLNGAAQDGDEIQRHSPRHQVA